MCAVSATIYAAVAAAAAGHRCVSAHVGLLGLHEHALVEATTSCVHSTKLEDRLPSECSSSAAAA